MGPFATRQVILLLLPFPFSDLSAVLGGAGGGIVAWQRRGKKQPSNFIAHTAGIH